MNNRQILVVDDDKLTCSALKRTFLDNNWTVETAYCGFDALELMTAGGAFDVVIADYFMPNINGTDFLKQVNRQFPETFCILLTAYPYCDSIKFAMKKYLKTEILQKPWGDELTMMITDALDARYQQQSGMIS